jgi:AcrR family transcriptional regulator
VTSAPVRERIITSAAALLAEGGLEAVSTRSVSAAAGVQSPAIYRHFGDMGELLDAVAEHGFESYLATKGALTPSGDPVEDLRRGWDLHVDFGVGHPALYSLAYGQARPGVETPAARRASAILATRIKAIAVAGRLSINETAAAHLVHAAGCGATFTLIAMPPDQRDPDLSVRAREAAIAAVTTDGAARQPDEAQRSAVVAMRALAPDIAALSGAERALLVEWMERAVQ